MSYLELFLYFVVGVAGSSLLMTVPMFFLDSKEIKRLREVEKAFAQKKLGRL